MFVEQPSVIRAWLCHTKVESVRGGGCLHLRTGERRRRRIEEEGGRLSKSRAWVSESWRGWYIVRGVDDDLLSFPFSFHTRTAGYSVIDMDIRITLALSSQQPADNQPWSAPPFFNLTPPLIAEHGRGQT